VKWFHVVVLIFFLSTVVSAESVFNGYETKFNEIVTPRADKEKGIASAWCAKGNLKFEGNAWSCSTEDGFLVGVLYGSFSASNQNEVLVMTCGFSDGCRPEAILMRLESKGWRVVSSSNISAFECIKFRRADGRDTPVCRNKSEAYGDPLGDYEILNLDFSQQKVTERKILNVKNYRYDLCAENSFVSARLSRPTVWARRDVNKDGIKDLEIDVLTSRVNMQEWCNAGQIDFSSKPAPRESETRTLTLTYLFDGRQFSPTPATKQFQRVLEGGQ
jgi:hypothetical protein